jgi:HAD superfamily hydrolase (TIGR01509 family)
MKRPTDKVWAVLLALVRWRVLLQRRLIFRLLELSPIGRVTPPAQAGHLRAMKISSTIIIFDVEGTLIDCAAQTIQSWESALLEFGHAVSRERLQFYSGMDGGEMLDHLLAGESADTKKAILKRQGKIYEQHHLRAVRPFPNVQELFTTLKTRGITLAIGTTCKRDELAIYDEHMRVLELAAAIACGDEVKRGKPHPDLFRSVLQKLKADSSAPALVVGDTPYDAKAASVLGLPAVGVLTGGFQEEALRSAGYDRVLPRVQNLALLQSVRPELGATLRS